MRWAAAVALGLALAFGGGPMASAQEEMSEEAYEAQKAELIDHYFRMMSHLRGAGGALKVLVEGSFNTRLRPDKNPAEGLSLAGIAYDPQAPVPLSAGSFLYHLAYPIAIKHWLPNGGDGYVAKLLEARIAWMAGAPDTARRIVEEMLAQAAEWEWEDRFVASALADAWILAERAGDTDAALAYLTRAMACEGFCTDDILYQALKSARKTETNQDISDLGTPEEFRVFARETAEALLPGHTEILDQIDREARLQTPGAGRELAQADFARLLAAARDPDAAALSPDERLRLTRLVLRLKRTRGMSFFPQSDMREVLAIRRDLGRPFTPEERDAFATTVDYMADFSLFAARTKEYAMFLPMVRALGDAEDRLAAEVMIARLHWTRGRETEALRRIEAVLAGAAEAGLGDARLQSVLSDAWMLALRAGEADAAEAYRLRAETCLSTQSCDDTLMARAAARWDARGHLSVPAEVWRQSDGAPFLELFADRHGFDAASLFADLYKSQAYVAEDTRPVDAARDAETSLRYLLTLAGTDGARALSQANGNLRILVRAGQYRTAADLAAELADKAAPAQPNDTYLRLWARALFHLDDPQAREIYDRLVTRLLGAGTIPDTDILLDLLDTPYLDVTDRLLSAWAETYPSALARLRHRQGRPAEAAAIIRGRWEATAAAIARPVMEPILQATLDRHRAMGRPDGIARAAAALQRLKAGEFDDLEHPAILRYDITAPWLVQEAAYRAAAGETAEAARLRALVPRAPVWSLSAEGTVEVAEPGAPLVHTDSDDITGVFHEFRDWGNYEGAAYLVRWRSAMASDAVLQGEYSDAQALWQLAFTAARGGDQELAFDLMSAAAHIAANLSFENAQGADGGSLQLLERDRWRYLLFIDIAWASATGRTPEDMTIVSRY